MSDDFEKNLRQHLHSEAEETRELPQRLRGRIRDGIAPRTRARMAPQLALAGALVLVAVAVLAFRSPAILNVITSNFNKVVQPSPSPTAAPTPAPTPAPTVSPSATDLGPFTCADHSGGADTGLAMQLTAVRIAHQTGYDRIVFEFAPQAGGTAHLPAYTVSRQASTQFVKDPSGQAVTMRGSAGLRIVFHGASGATSYSGSRDQTPGLPVVQEVEQLGDFEAVLSWGAGLSQASCIRTLELSNPTRLAIDVQTP
jgi:hypothetical protein